MNKPLLIAIYIVWLVIYTVVVIYLSREIPEEKGNVFLTFLIWLIPFLCFTYMLVTNLKTY